MAKTYPKEDVYVSMLNLLNDAAKYRGAERLILAYRHSVIRLGAELSRRPSRQDKKQ